MLKALALTASPTYCVHSRATNAALLVLKPGDKATRLGYHVRVETNTQRLQTTDKTLTINHYIWYEFSRQPTLIHNTMLYETSSNNTVVSSRISPTTSKYCPCDVKLKIFTCTTYIHIHTPKLIHVKSLTE